MNVDQEHPDPQRVLIIKPSAIGDVVHALPVLPKLKKRWPAAKISWLITPQCAPLVQRHPMVDEVVLFQRKRFGRWYNPAALLDLAEFIRDIRLMKFDLVIDLQGLFRSALVGVISGARRRVGFSNARELAPLFYTQTVECSWDMDHAVERYLKVVTDLGCAGDGAIEFPLAVDESDRRFIAEMIPPQVRYAVLMPGTHWETKRWPVERFAELVKPLKDRFDLATVAAGSPADAPLTKQLGATFDLTGKTNLRQMVALLERASLVIANDTGPMHIAAALGRPLVTPYGPTSPRRTGPFGRMDSVIRLDMPCSPCYSRTCSHRSCMEWLSGESVLELAEQQMKNWGR
ncbi:MAG: lipopolysaccharide heptosyltransferase I [Tepidisphaeraceae bacterium]